MSQRVRVEIKARDEFWQKAILIEWAYRYPDRKLGNETDRWYLIDSDWIDALKEVAIDCNSTIVVGPSDLGRRSLFQKFMPTRDSE